ncbi:MAG TPA: DUF3196 family protein [Erysipelothrix sp.]|nr:DUF3196 family protein [Erysipelothrix sp.]
MNYYQEIEQKIKENMDSQNYQDALELIESELSMPYIPQDLQEKLEEWHKECLTQLDQNPAYALSFEVISQWLFDIDPIKVESALLGLKDINLRNYIDDIQKLLEHHPDRLVQSFILLECINQEIDTTFKFNKFGLDYEVNPIYIEHPIETDGYQIASQKLSEITFKEPSLNELVQQLLIGEVIEALPNSYDELEGEMLAYSIFKEGLRLLNRDSEWYNFTVEQNIKEERCPTLFSTL